MAEKEEKIEVEGEVVESFRSGMYRIALENGHETLGYTSGKMRRYRIRINPGDHVKVELSPYDLTRGPHRLPQQVATRYFFTTSVARIPSERWFATAQ